MTMLTNRYDFVLLFDVQDGNPNGDPDLGNQPRIDLETGVGLVTDVCLKRKVRNYVMFKKNGVDHYDIFIKEKGVLNRFISEEWDIASGKRTPAEVKKAQESQKIESDARTRMCKRYFDVRTFGAVMSTGDKGAGQVRGPIQMTFSRSSDGRIAGHHGHRLQIDGQHQRLFSHARCRQPCLAACVTGADDDHIVFSH